MKFDVLVTEKEKFYEFYKSLNAEERTRVYCFKPGTVLVLSIFLRRMGFEVTENYVKNTVSFGTSGPYRWYKFYLGDTDGKHKRFQTTYPNERSRG